MPNNAIRPVSELVIPFGETVTSDDRILDVLDKMIEHWLSLVPIVEEGKLKGIVRLSNVFGTMAAVVFEKEARWRVVLSPTPAQLGNGPRTGC